MKKGVLKLVVEIDYDAMITEDKIETLKGFTGIDNAEELMEYHMSQLGEKLNNVVKDLPLMKYSIVGNFVPVEAEKEEVIVEEEVLDEMPIEETITDHQEILITKSSLNEYFKKLLDSDIENTSIVDGMPVKILINDKMEKAIKEDSGYLMVAESQNSKIIKYQGFPVEVEAMEELYIIQYKEYGTNQIKEHSKKITKE